MRLLKRPTLSLALSCMLLFTLYYFLSQTSKLQDPQPLDPNSYPIPTKNKLDLHVNEDNDHSIDELEDKSRKLSEESSGDDNLKAKFIDNDESITIGEISPNIMPQMTNETLKAALGRSSWHLFHTILARYPESPTLEEKTTLKQYIYLFSQVYPCGDCAKHFQQLLKKYPPQVSGRVNAALWGCELHNKVNDRLGKDRYDCSNILEDYDCGCGDDEELQSQGKLVNQLTKEELEFEKEALSKDIERTEFKKDSTDNDHTAVEEDHLRFEISNEGKQGG